MLIMVRPVKARFVRGPPRMDYFKPREIPLSTLDGVVLKVEELEAIKLKDLESLDQGERVNKMKISGGTFQRVLNSPKKKLLML